MEKFPMIRAVIAGVVLIGGIGIAVAQQDPATIRKALMKDNGKNEYGTGLSGMVRGQKPYDQAFVDAALDQFEKTAKQLPTLFPDTAKESVPGGEYKASSKIWDNKADFEDHIAKFAAEVTQAKAKIKDLDSLKAEYPTLNGACNSCHETYRVKNG
jgi:cytochrome c556